MQASEDEDNSSVAETLELGETYSRDSLELLRTSARVVPVHADLASVPCSSVVAAADSTPCSPMTTRSIPIDSSLSSKAGMVIVNRSIGESVYTCTCGSGIIAQSLACEKALPRFEQHP